MKLKTHMLLLIVMLIPVQSIAAENSEQGEAKPPAEQRLNTSATSSAKADTGAQTVPAMVDKVDVYILHPAQATSQKNSQ